MLTGEPPKIETIRLSYDEARGTFTLAFMPWVSKATMLQVRRVAQRYCDSGALKDKALGVYRFVAERTDAQKRKPWEKLRAEWNEQHPDLDQHFANRSSIATAYQRAEEKLAGSWARTLEVRVAGDVDLAWPDVGGTT